MGRSAFGWFWLTLSISFLGFISLAFVNVVISTFLITKIDEHLIGRVNGTITPLFIGAMLMGSFLSGVLMQHTSLLNRVCFFDTGADGSGVAKSMYTIRQSAIPGWDTKQRTDQGRGRFQLIDHQIQIRISFLDRISIGGYFRFALSPLLVGSLSLRT